MTHGIRPIPAPPTPAQLPPAALAALASVEAVNNTVAKLRLEYRNKSLRENCSGTVHFGLYGNLIGAEVSAEQRIEIGKQDEYVCVRHVIVVACSGFGCTKPLTEVGARDLIFDCDHGDITEEGRMDARKQAQAHAETCRAMPRPAVTK